MPVASLVEKVAARDFSANPIPLSFLQLNHKLRLSSAREFFVP